MGHDYAHWREGIGEGMLVLDDQPRMTAAIECVRVVVKGLIVGLVWEV